jgi:predicted nucleotidyltransferase
VAPESVNPVEAALRLVTVELNRTGRPWALVGGLAVSARAEPRTTRDVDVAVSAANDAEAEALVLELQSRGFRVLAALEQEAVSRLATVRMVAQGEAAHGIVVDLLFASSGIEPDISARADVVDVLPGVRMPVARIGDLMALKMLARDDRRRPQDLDDLRALLREADETDLLEARQALSAIEARGFHRGRMLTQTFEEFLEQERS